MKKWVFLLPALQSGGMERVMTEIIRYCCKQPDVECHLVLYINPVERFYDLPRNLILHVTPLVFNEKKRALFALRSLWYLRRTVVALRPDAVLSFGELWNSLVLMALLFTGIKVLISDRCKPDKSFGFFHDTCRSVLYPGATLIIAQTGYAAAVYRQKFPGCRLAIIANPIRMIESAETDYRPPVVLSVGRLIHTKHFDRLIHIFENINAPQWKLVIVGGEALKQSNTDSLNSLISDLGLTGRVELVGEQQNVDDFYRRARIFAFTSSSEGFPNVIGEAMSAALPVVAYDCIAGPSDLIDHGVTGFLTDVFDDKQFEHYLQKLINDDELREKMGRDGRQRVGLFSVEQIGNQFFQVMASC